MVDAEEKFDVVLFAGWMEWMLGEVVTRIRIRASFHICTSITPPHVYICRIIFVGPRLFWSHWDSYWVKIGWLGRLIQCSLGQTAEKIWQWVFSNNIKNQVQPQYTLRGKFNISILAFAFMHFNYTFYFKNLFKEALVLLSA